MKQFEDTPYYVTKDGRVFRNGKELKPYVAKGYHRVTFSINGKTQRWQVHRLVALLYIDNPDQKPFVNHINSIRTDNRVENLEWVTHSENMKHCAEAGNGTFLIASQKLAEYNDARKKREYKEEYGDQYIDTYLITTKCRKGTRRNVKLRCLKCQSEFECREDSTLLSYSEICCAKCRKRSNC